MSRPSQITGFVLAGTAALASLAVLAARQDASLPTIYMRTADGEMGGGWIPSSDGDERALAAPPVARRTDAPLAAAASAPPYTFFPQAGSLWQDLYVNNFVDLDGSTAVSDYECSEYTYDTHNGHDVDLAGFREQEIGVPIFAALDGVVAGSHDGEPDRETTAGDRPGNYVILSHAGGYRTVYGHLKTNSVTVSDGQSVKAGTQIGLTGSSGSSTWPHLHFTSLLNNVAFEPNSGGCRPGPSAWTNQVNIRRDSYVKTFVYGLGPFAGNLGYPFDEVTRLGTYVRGTSAVYFRMDIGTIPIQSTYRIVISRPNGTVASDTTNGFSNTVRYRHSWFWFSRPVALDVVGDWGLDFYINGAKIATAPFIVVASAGEVLNRAPLPLQAVAFEPRVPATADVPICRVTTATIYRRDPDYDLVRYRYRWTINGVVVREITSAALSDAIPAGVFKAGDGMACMVTPYDESLSGPSMTATIEPAPLLQPPTGLTWTTAGNGVTLTWTAPTIGPTPVQYVIEAGSATGLANLAVLATGSPTTTFSTSGVPNGLYFVRVRSATAMLQSVPSGEANVVVGCTAPPTAPTTARLVSIAGSTVTIAWNRPTGDVTTYFVEAGSAAGLRNLANIDIGGAALTMSASGVPRGTYFVRIRAANSCGNGPVSNEFVVTVP